MELSDPKSCEVPIPLSLKYYLVPGSDPQRDDLVVFFHGFSDTANSLYRRAFERKQLPAPVFLPNGFFPVPVKSEGGFRESYAWYFLDYQKNITYISAEVSADAFVAALTKLELVNKRIWVVGFSQGGFYAPIVAQRLPNVAAVIGVGCDFPLKNYPEKPRWPVFAIHGDDDEVLEVNNSEKNHQALLKNGYQGSFTRFAKMNHQLDGRVRERLQEILLSN